MCMSIRPGVHDQSRRVHNLTGVAVDTGLDRRDLTVGYRHVPNVVQSERGVDDRSTPDEQVVQFDTLRQSQYTAKAALVYHAARLWLMQTTNCRNWMLTASQAN